MQLGPSQALQSSTTLEITTAKPWRKLETELKACLAKGAELEETLANEKAKAEEAAALHAKAIADYKRQLAEQSEKYEADMKAMREKLEQASVDAVKSSEKVAIAAEASTKHALDSTRAILASLGGDASDTEKKADSLGE